MSDETTADWYESMASAIREREKCKAAIAKWQKALSDAETAIAVLAKKQPVPLGATFTVTTNAPQVTTNTNTAGL